MPVVAGPFEATAVGNVLMQLKALGAFASFDEACEAVQPSLSFTTYRPSGEVPQDVINLYRHIRKRG